MKLTIYIFCILIVQTLQPEPFSYDSAIYAAQKGNWKDAYAALNNIITHNPDNADVMYDAGVATYNLGNSCQAATCFTRAAECSADKDICFRGYFNAGNAYVDQKDLKSALEQYDKALAIEPDNEYARHNRDRVEQMLQQQENEKKDQSSSAKATEDRQDDQQKDDKEKKEDEKENKQEQNGNDDQSGDKQDQNGDQNKQKGKQSSSAKASADKLNKESQGDQKNETSNDGSSNKQSQRDQGNDAADGSQNTERKEQGNKEQQQKNSANNEQRDGKDELDKKANGAQNKDEKQQSDQHAQAPEKQNNITNDKNNVSSGGKQEQVIDDPWLLSVLNNQEIQDKAINKQLMEAKIRQHGGKNGQNCW